MRSSALLQNVLGCLRLQKDICIRYILLLLLRHLMNSFQMGFNMRNISTKERVRVQNNQKIKDFVFQTKTSMYMVDYWTGVRYVLNFEATKTVSTQQTIRVHVSQKSKTCRTHVQQFFIEHLPTTTFQCEERNFGYKVLLVSNSDAAAWHSFKATLIFICQCCSWAPPLSCHIWSCQGPTEFSYSGRTWYAL